MIHGKYITPMKNSRTKSEWECNTDHDDMVYSTVDNDDIVYR